MRIRLAVGIAMALALSACGGQTKSAPDSSATSATSAATSTESSSPVPTSQDPSSPVAAPGAAPTKGEKPTREFLIGKWGTDGDCSLAVDLRADGTSDGPFGNWTYNDGTIGFVDEPDFKVRVTILDDNNMESTNDQSAKTTRMNRCP